MRPVLQGSEVLPDQSKVWFVNQRCGLESMIGALPAKVARRDSPRFVVNDGRQRLNRRLPVAAPLLQNDGDFAG